MFPDVVMMRRHRMERPPEEMKASAKEGSLMEDWSLNTAIFRSASSSLDREARRVGIEDMSIVALDDLQS